MLPAELPRLPAAYANQCTPDLQKGILSVLEQVHSGYAIRPNALALLVQLCNRFAHTLCLLLDKSSNKDASDPFLFPPCAGMGELCTYGNSEAVKAQTKLLNGDAKGGLCFVRSDTTRWMEEFHELHPESKLSSSITPMKEIAILAWVEYITAELIEVAGKFTMRRQSFTIEGQDLIRGILNDKDLASMAMYLGTSSISYLDAMYDHFEPNRSAWLTFDLAYGWYHDAVQVKRYAQQYARGELLPGDEYFFRQHGVRPLQFWGNRRSLDPVMRRKYQAMNDNACYDDVEEKGEKRCQHAIVFSFEVRDAQGVWVPFVCELRAQRSLARFFLADTGQFAAEIAPNDVLIRSQLPARCMIKLEDHDVARFGPLPPHRHSNKKQRLESSPQAVMIHVKLPDPATISKPLPNATVFPTRVSGASSVELTRKRKEYEDALAIVNGSLLDELEEIRPKAILEDKLLIATQLVRLDLFSPALFTSNHPLAVRERFTAELIDYVSTQNNLPTLPTVLLQLIGEYEPANDLPYISTHLSSDTQSYADASKRFTQQVLQVPRPLSLNSDDVNSEEDE
jgi:hypothetical protein